MLPSNSPHLNSIANALRLPTPECPPIPPGCGIPNIVSDLSILLQFRNCAYCGSFGAREALLTCADCGESYHRSQCEGLRVDRLDGTGTRILSNGPRSVFVRRSVVYGQCISILTLHNYNPSWCHNAVPLQSQIPTSNLALAGRQWRCKHCAVCRICSKPAKKGVRVRVRVRF